jgi:hypothetical protein
MLKKFRNYYSYKEIPAPGLSSKVLIQDATDQAKEIFDFVRYNNKIPFIDIRKKLFQPSVKQQTTQIFFSFFLNYNQRTITRTAII